MSWVKTIYKIRHKPTGKFYRRLGYQSKPRDRTNLCDVGRFIESKEPPNVPKSPVVRISDAQFEELPEDVKSKVHRWKENRIISSADDWEIVEYRVVEITKT